MNRAYLKTHDIDWFYRISNQYIHVASAGGMLPEGIKDLSVLRKIQRAIDYLPPVYNVELNREYITQNIIEKNYDYLDGDHIPKDNDFDSALDAYNLNIKEKLYYNTFIYFARRGFYSFDRTSLFDNDELYHLVARPIFSPKRHNRNLSIDGIPYIKTKSFNLRGNIAECTELKLTETINKEMRKES